MQKVVMLLAFVLTNQAYAADVVNPIQLLEEKVVPQVACDQNETRNFSQCLSDICGPADKFKTYKDVIKDLEYAEEGDFGPYRKQIETYINKKISQQIKSIPEIENYLSRENLNLDPEMINLAKFVEIINVLSSVDFSEIVEDSEIDGNRMMLKINSQKLSDGLKKHYGDAKSNQLKAPFIEFLNNKNFQKVMFGSQYGWALSLEKDYPGLALSEIIENEKEIKDKLMEKLKAMNPKAYSFIESRQIVNTRLIDKLQKEANPSEAMLNEYFSAMMFVRILDDYFFKPQPEFSKLNPKRIDEFYSKDEILKKANQVKRSLTSLSLESPEIQQNIQHCQAIFNKIQSALPTEKEREEYLRQIDLYKKEFKRVILGKLSEETAKTLGPKLDGVLFDVPASKEVMSELMLESLKDLELDIDGDKKLKTSDANNKDYILLDILNLMEYEQEKFTGDAAQDCDSYELGSLEDFSLQIGSGKIKVSWLTLKVPEMGKGIVAHELGHALAGIMKENVLSEHSAKVFKESRQCLNNGSYSIANESIIYKTNEGQVADSYITDLFVEENWADMISANVLEKSGVNFGCFLLDKNDSGLYDSNILFPTDEKDTHAPNLNRVLKIQSILKGVLPSSCKKLLKPDELKYFEKRCF
ncbi:MAG: hypothetical protein AB7I27_12710 [Bacteriovoracaceae bacterium]